MFTDSDHVATNRNVLRPEHLAFNGEVFERFEDFDYTEVERSLGELPDDPDPDADSEELAGLLQWIWAIPGDLTTARQRFDALGREALANPGGSRAAVGFEKLVRWCS